jgi:hypothetical protein
VEKMLYAIIKGINLVPIPNPNASSIKTATVNDAI